MSAQVHEILSHARYLATRAARIHPGLADDLAQETLLRALRFRDRFEVGNLRAWLMRLMRHELCRMIAAERRAKEAPPGYDQPRAALEPQLHAVALRETLAGIMSLPDRQRALVIAAIDAPSYQHLAAEFGMPMGTLKSTLSRARSLLAAADGPMRAASQ